MDELRTQLRAMQPMLDLSELFDDSSVTVACCSPGVRADSRRVHEGEPIVRSD